MYRERERIMSIYTSHSATFMRGVRDHRRAMASRKDAQPFQLCCLSNSLKTKSPQARNAETDPCHGTPTMALNIIISSSSSSSSTYSYDDGYDYYHHLQPPEWTHLAFEDLVHKHHGWERGNLPG